MSKFVTGEELTHVVYSILFEAKQRLLLVSPYIKLDNYFRKILDQHVHNPQLEILVVFGKNAGHVTRSMSRDDLDYFTKFPHVTLVHAPALHAKYYGNELKGVVTSINLYDYSFKNNIEFGVYSEVPPLMSKLLDSMGNKHVDDQAFAQAVHVAATNDVIFVRRPCYKLRQGFLAKLTSSKDYLEPTVLFDAIDEIVSNRPYSKRKLDEFPKEVEFEQTLAQTLPPRSFVPPANLPAYTEPRHNTGQWQQQQHSDNSAKGYCIRTGEPIPFDPSRPFSWAAYKTWASFGDEDYPEKYCHKTGRPSHGRTSMSRPML